MKERESKALLTEALHIRLPGSTVQKFDGALWQKAGLGSGQRFQWMPIGQQKGRGAK
jgi:hypothetical protein